MAKVYSAPIEAPTLDSTRTNGRFDLDKYRASEAAYIEQLRALAKQNGSSELLGELLRFGRGDGYALYMVWRTRPLELIWLQVGDCWSVEDALIRGLRVSDVREQVERERRIQDIFTRSTVPKR